MRPLFLLIAGIVLFNTNGLYEPTDTRVTVLPYIGPDCLDSYVDSLATHQEVEIQIQSEDIVLSGRLFLPSTSEPHPAVIMIQGGGNNTERLRNTPLFFAPRLAHCGVAALVYDKRGTGESEGTYETSTFDDFVMDAGNGVRFLARHNDIDPSRIGVLGFSQGGRLAPVVGVRYPHVSFVVSVSGPLTSVEDTRLFALENSFRRAGVADSLLRRVMPLWREHFAAIAIQDQAALNELDAQLDGITGSVHGALLPPRSEQLPRTGVYNSVGRDYTTEIAQLRVPWFSLYGERDTNVPVEESVDILHERMAAGDHQDYEIEIVPSASHGFINTETGQRIRFEAKVLAWILNKIEQ